MRQEEKYYDLIIKVNNHEVFSDESSEELDTTQHRKRPLEPIVETLVETTDEKPISMEDL